MSTHRCMWIPFRIIERFGELEADRTAINQQLTALTHTEPPTSTSATTVPAVASGSPTTRVTYTNATGRNSPDPKLSTPSAVSSAARLFLTGSIELSYQR